MKSRQVRRPMDEDLLDPSDRRIVYPQRVGFSSEGMISTQHYLATEVGANILKKGGNAIDAAVAAAFSLGVVEPTASGLGGQTMMVIYLSDSGRKFCLDGSTRAPNRTPTGELQRDQRRWGHQAATVPSTPAVLEYTLKHYGTMNLSDVLEPAIKLAEEGYRISPLQHYLSHRELKHLKLHSGGLFFLKNGKIPYPIGSIFRQPVLAATLKRLSSKGVEDFYQGEIARLIHEDMISKGGFIREDDLARIPWPVERRPLSTHFDNMRIFTLGPPGAGRTLIEALNMLEQFSENKRNPDSPEGALLLAYIIRKANLDRADRPEDPALFAQELEFGEDITHVKYAERIAGRIRARLKSHGDTTHLSVMDKLGNVVSLTQSIEQVYGSFSLSPKLGFLYNNYMSSYEYRDISHPYYLRPNAVPWASVAPSIIFKGKQPWLAIGSPGSERIVSAIIQVLLRLQRGASPLQAVEAPRLHSAISGKVSLEATRMRNDLPHILSRHGFCVDIRDPYSFYLGSIQLVVRQKKDYIGVADLRRDGSAEGPDNKR